MRRVEELLAKHPGSPEWDDLLLSPTCRDFEEMHLKVTNLRDFKPDGSVYTSSGSLIARFCRASVIGLDEWDGPDILEDSVILEKNPSRDILVTNYGKFGINNGLVRYDNYVFAARIAGSAFYVTRPVQRLFQPQLVRGYDRHLSNVTADLPVFRN